MVHIMDFCEEEAKKGKSEFAVAHAIYQLAHEIKALAGKLPDHDNVAIALDKVADAVNDIGRHND